MAAEKLPPDGYELGPGWKVGSGAPFCSTRRLPLGNCHRDVAYTNEGEAVGLCVMHSLLDGAIVRKAEAPTPEMRARIGAQVFRTATSPPEQPSRNAGELPAEAPAAPVGEPSEARHLAHAFVTANRLDCEKERPSPEPRPEHFPLCDRLTDVIQRAIDPRDARISALEAEVAARLVERDGWMEAAAKSEREKAALQAELAEATSHVNDVAEAYRRTLAECRQRIGDGTPIKNGDPAP